MLIEQINGVYFKPLQRPVDALSDVFRLTIQADRMRVTVGINLKPEFGCDQHLVADRRESFTYKFFIHERSVDLSGVEEIDTAFHRVANEGDHLLPRPCHRPVAGTQSHAAKSDGRDFQAAITKFPFLHDGPLLMELKGQDHSATTVALRLFLFPSHCGPSQTIMIEDGVKDQGVVADGFAAIDRIAAEQQHAALAEVRIHYHGMFGDGTALVEKSIEQQILAS